MLNCFSLKMSLWSLTPIGPTSIQYKMRELPLLTRAHNSKSLNHHKTIWRQMKWKHSLIMGREMTKRILIPLSPLCFLFLVWLTFTRASVVWSLIFVTALLFSFRPKMTSYRFVMKIKAENVSSSYQPFHEHSCCQLCPESKTEPGKKGKIIFAYSELTQMRIKWRRRLEMMKALLLNAGHWLFRSSMKIVY